MDLSPPGPVSITIPPPDVLSYRHKYKLTCISPRPTNEFHRRIHFAKIILGHSIQFNSKYISQASVGQRLEMDSFNIDWCSLDLA